MVAVPVHPGSWSQHDGGSPSGPTWAASTAADQACAFRPPQSLPVWATVLGRAVVVVWPVGQTARQPVRVETWGVDVGESQLGGHRIEQLPPRLTFSLGGRLGQRVVGHGVTGPGLL